MIDSLKNLGLDAGTAITFSRGLIALIWLWALVRMWEYRHLPHTNHAMAGALSIVLCHGLLMLQIVPLHVMIFFIALANITLGISFVRLTLDLAEVHALHSGTVEHPSVARRNLMSTAAGIVVTVFMSTLLRL